MTLSSYLAGRYLAGIDTHPRRERIKSVLTSLVAPYERRKARELTSAGSGLRLHIGCGNIYLNDWVNIDLMRPGWKLDLRWDLRRGLPFPDGSANAIFSEHFFEHLDLKSSLDMMVECRRVLAKGGICRIAVPDFERYLKSYAGDDTMIHDMRSASPTRLMAINEIIYFHGHRSMYDAETMKALLIEAGFASAEQSRHGQSRLVPCPDSKIRQLESLYVEAIV